MMNTSSYLALATHKTKLQSMGLGRKYSAEQEWCCLCRSTQATSGFLKTSTEYPRPPKKGG